MALHYAPVIYQQEKSETAHDTAASGLVGLPDLTGRLQKMGMLESYKSWSKDYRRWRRGGALGAKGEIMAQPSLAATVACSETDLPDLSDRIRRSGMYEAYKFWSDGYRHWRKGASRGATGELTGECAPRCATGLTTCRQLKIDWPEADDGLLSADSQAMILYCQPQKNVLGSESQSTIRSTACKKRGIRSMPKIDWPEAGEGFPCADRQCMALQYQPGMRKLASEVRSAAEVQSAVRPQMCSAAKKASWPEASAIFPDAAAQAMALRYEPQVITVQ